MRILWDEPKRRTTLVKHGLDFADLGPTFFENAVVRRVRQERLQAIGPLSRRLIAVVFLPMGAEAFRSSPCATPTAKKGRFMRPRIPPLTDEEEAEAQRQIADDPDNPEASDEEMADFRPFAEALPELMESIRRSRGRPPKPDAKQAVTLRLDPETVARFKAQGPDWRARMGAALKRAAGT